MLTRENALIHTKRHVFIKFFCAPFSPIVFIHETGRMCVLRVAIDPNTCATLGALHILAQPRQNPYSSTAHGANDNKHFIVLRQRYNKLCN